MHTALILVVEDNATIQKLVSMFARKRGVECVIAGTCAEAMQLFESGNAFDAVFMDWSLPDGTGLDCARWIRAQEVFSGKHVPIIAMTANLMPGDRELCLEAGMDDFIGKPFFMADFNAIMGKWLGETHPSNVISLPPPRLEGQEGTGA
jgi:CheY-like chemotaxis protein